eukprot:365174-Chlamydomonas_euryale.AAC.5
MQPHTTAGYKRPQPHTRYRKRPWRRLRLPTQSLGVHLPQNRRLAEACLCADGAGGYEAASDATLYGQAEGAGSAGGCEVASLRAQVLQGEGLGAVQQGGRLGANCDEGRLAVFLSSRHRRLALCPRPHVLPRVLTRHLPPPVPKGGICAPLTVLWSEDHTSHACACICRMCARPLVRGPYVACVRMHMSHVCTCICRMCTRACRMCTHAYVACVRVL